jgi:hypothetical protein
LKILFHQISIFSPLIPVLVFLLFSFNKKIKLKQVIFILITLGVFTDVLSYIVAKKSLSTLLIINFFTLAEGSLLTYFFYLLFSKSKLSKKIASVLGICFIIMWVVRNIFFQKINNYDYLSQAIEFIFLLFLCLLYFFQTTKISNTIFIYNTYEFWLVSALLIYCAGTFFSFFIPMNANERNTDTVVFEYISRIGNIIKSILITTAFCINPANLSKNQPNKNSIYYVKDLNE